MSTSVAEPPLLWVSPAPTPTPSPRHRHKRSRSRRHSLRHRRHTKGPVKIKYLQ